MAMSAEAMNQLGIIIGQTISQTIGPLMAQSQENTAAAISETIQSVMKSGGNNKPGRIFDPRMLQNLKSFAGNSDFHEWQRKVKNYMRCVDRDVVTMMDKAEKQIEPIPNSEIKRGHGDEGLKLSEELNAFLESHTEGPAAQIIAAAHGSGIEAWRLLTKRYDPRTSESKRALMKRVVNTPAVKDMADLENAVQKWETDWRRYERATDTDLSDDIKVNCLIALCPPRLEDHLNMTIKDEEDYDEVRSQIFRQIEKSRAASEPSPMDVGNWERHDSDVWESPPEGVCCEEIGTVGQSSQCYRCWGYGHMSSQCPTPKGKGKATNHGYKGSKGNFKGFKGDDYKGYTGDSKGVKGGSKGGTGFKGHFGKGSPANHRGKGYPINGSCYNCGDFGHMSKDCWAKGHNKGGKSAYCIEEEPVEENQAEISGFEIGIVERLPLDTPPGVAVERVPETRKSLHTSIPTHNRYEALGETADEPWEYDVNVVDAPVAQNVGPGKITIDSGAAESVMPVDFLNSQPMEPSPAGKRGTRYIAANGDVMHNVGQKRIKFRTKDGAVSAITFQATGVRKPLAAVSRIVEKGNQIVFSPSENYIMNLATGKRTELEMENGTYVMNVQYIVDESQSSQGFSRQR